MMLGGLRVIVSPDRPQYVLPDEVIPGVPWPAGFRDEINAWAASFFKPVNSVPAGQALIVGDTVYMRPAQVEMLRKSAQVKAYDDAEHDRRVAKYSMGLLARHNLRA